MAQAGPVRRIIHGDVKRDAEKIRGAINRLDRGGPISIHDDAIVLIAAKLYLQLLEDQQPEPPATDAPYSFWLGEFKPEYRQTLNSDGSVS